MAARNSNKKDENNLGFNIKELKEICMKYKKYIAAGAMVVLLAVVISTSQAGSKDPESGSGPSGASVSDGQGQEGQEEFEVDAYPELNALIENYFKYYAAGDTDALEKIAYPVTDTEKSYIKLFSKYIDKYDNIKCYTKKGITDGEYIVEASLDMLFKEVKTGAPNLECFYVRTDDSGSLYIDNAYSQFNQSKKFNESGKENTTDSDVNTRMTEFEQEEDVSALVKEVQDNYLAALENDEELNKMVTVTVQDAISDWVASFDTQTDTDGSEGKDGSGTDESDGETQTKVQTRTAYATKDVNMREKRTINSEPILTLKRGSEVTIYGTSKNGWFKIKYKGKTGFARKEYFTADKSKLTGKKDTGNETADNKTDDNKTTNEKTADNKTDSSKTDNSGSSAVQKRTAYAKETVRMRKKASTDSKVLRMLKPGAKVTIYGTSTDGWFKVKKQGETGYVKKEYLTTDPSKVKKEEDTPSDSPSSSSGPSYYSEGTRVTLSDSVNVRKSMSESADKVGVAFRGDVLTVIMSYAEGWTKVSWNGETGYVKTEFLK